MDNAFQKQRLVFAGWAVGPAYQIDDAFHKNAWLLQVAIAQHIKCTMCSKSACGFACGRDASARLNTMEVIWANGPICYSQGQRPWKAITSVGKSPNGASCQAQARSNPYESLVEINGDSAPRWGFLILAVTHTRALPLAIAGRAVGPAYQMDNAFQKQRVVFAGWAVGPAYQIDDAF